MENYYKAHTKFYLAVDCIIFGFDEDGLKLLVVKRDFEPGKGQWSLVGGFLAQGENVDEAAQRILHKLTGLENIYLEQLATYGEPARDSAARVVSIAYYALISTTKFKENKSNRNACWYPLNGLPNLIFDHNQMVAKAILRLRRKAASRPIGFELLPAQFTLPQMQALYESIYQQQIDKRNFRKKILSMNILEKLPEKDMTGSKRGAYKYKFNPSKYNELLNNGYHFEIINNGKQ